MIHADIPWRFESYSEAGEERSAQRHYDCMSLRDMARLNVEAHAAEDCHLFFWVTGPFRWRRALCDSRARSDNRDLRRIRLHHSTG